MSKFTDNAAGSNAFWYLIGAGILGVAVYAAVTNSTVSEIAQKASDAFGETIDSLKNTVNSFAKSSNNTGPYVSGTIGSSIDNLFVRNASEMGAFFNTQNGRWELYDTSVRGITAFLNMATGFGLTAVVREDGVITKAEA